MFIIHFLQGLPNWLISMVISAVPIIELRGGIPLALTVLNMQVLPALIFCIIGSVIPVFPIFWFLDVSTRYAHKIPVLARFLDWLFARTRARSEQIKKYELIGLILFIAIPLPVTGVWTGTVAAFLFGLSRWKTFVAAMVGTTIAGLIMTIGSLGIKALF
ncbi:MAG: small multi-drug export protein [Candidatus Margulisiibacteriota bacterium]